MTKESKANSDAPEAPDRREFLAKAGRFAVVTPAAVTVLLSTSMDADAGIMKSVGNKYKSGHHGHHKKYGHGKHYSNKHYRRRQERFVWEWLNRLFSKFS